MKRNKIFGIITLFILVGCSNNAVFVKCPEFFFSKDPLVMGEMSVNTAQDALEILNQYTGYPYTESDLLFVKITLNSDQIIDAWVLDNEFAIDKNGTIYRGLNCL